MTRVLSACLLLVVVAAAALVIRAHHTTADEVATTRATPAAGGTRLERVLTAFGTMPRPEPGADIGSAASGAGAQGAASTSADDLEAELLGASRPLRPEDRDLLDPDGHSQAGELSAGDGGAPSSARHRYSLRLKRRTIAPGQPLEATIDVSTLEGRPLAFQVRRLETRDADSGRVAYVEHHRTLGDWVSLLAGHGFRLVRLLEPEWPAEHDRVWGGWSRTRGRLTPGTAVFAADLD
jgi:hypothetical protein